MSESKRSSGPRSVLVVHGPNLNLLGSREPDVYGSTTLAELNAALVDLGSSLGVRVTTAQENGEGAIIDLLQSAGQHHAAVIINPGGFSHTSIAIHDAIMAIRLPTIEVHLTNLYKRESFRHASVTGGACHGVIMGLGAASYHLALRYLAQLLATSPSA